MAFKSKDNALIEAYNAIQMKAGNLMQTPFYRGIYDNRYIKTKIKMYNANN